MSFQYVSNEIELPAPSDTGNIGTLIQCGWMTAKQNMGIDHLDPDKVPTYTWELLQPKAMDLVFSNFLMGSLRVQVTKLRYPRISGCFEGPGTSARRSFANHCLYLNHPMHKLTKGHHTRKIHKCHQSTHQVNNQPSKFQL